MNSFCQLDLLQSILLFNAFLAEGGMFSLLLDGVVKAKHLSTDIVADDVVMTSLDPLVPSIL